ncbi:hypothetical protein KUTeg_005115 [Tegillarca granosa]|uniref:Uncharacterized protein n=1 Tax=Tegillarca granosa TaxID=220873 RepID=A0ABQ9FIU4_TEGGR|nr:hypothetical protein KUTeg_005115 [Tegillarca granosa]
MLSAENLSALPARPAIPNSSLHIDGPPSSTRETGDGAEVISRTTRETAEQNISEESDEDTLVKEPNVSTGISYTASGGASNIVTLTQNIASNKILRRSGTDDTDNGRQRNDEKSVKRTKEPVTAIKTNRFQNSDEIERKESENVLNNHANPKYKSEQARGNQRITKTDKAEMHERSKVKETIESHDNFIPAEDPVNTTLCGQCPADTSKSGQGPESELDSAAGTKSEDGPSQRSTLQAIGNFISGTLIRMVTNPDQPFLG